MPEPYQSAWATLLGILVLMVIVAIAMSSGG